MGPSWHGKTAAAYAIANDAAERGSWVEAWFVPTLADLLGPTPRHLWDDTGHAAAVEDAAHRAASCDLLVLDDLGREDSREGLLERWRVRLLVILNERTGDRRRLTIVTGNSKDRAEVPQRIAARYGSPVLNRLLMDSARVWVEGEPFRTRERDLFGQP
jgi:DNA replication protein DnaC